MHLSQNNSFFWSPFAIIWWQLEQTGLKQLSQSDRSAIFLILPQTEHIFFVPLQF
jgi:hypothetical protein